MDGNLVLSFQLGVIKCSFDRSLGDLEWIRHCVSCTCTRIVLMCRSHFHVNVFDGHTIFHGSLFKRGQRIGEGHDINHLHTDEVDDACVKFILDCLRGCEHSFTYIFNIVYGGQRYRGLISTGGSSTDRIEFSMG